MQIFLQYLHGTNKKYYADLYYFIAKIHHLCAILVISKSEKEQTRLAYTSQYRDSPDGALRPRTVRALLFKRDDRGIAK